MQAEEYSQLYRAETIMWWFRAMHYFISRLLPKQLQGRNLMALDIGCGTGAMLSKLAAAGFTSYGLDVSATALEYAARRGRGLVRASANSLPFDSAFDLVVSIDVLEVANVDPERFAQAAIMSLKPGGYGLFVTAAHQWLMSEHDRAVDSVRRYNLVQVRSLFRQPGVAILRSTYLFFLLFPLIAVRKLLNPKRRFGTDKARSDVKVPPKLVNEILYRLCVLEGSLLPVISFPFGSSALVLVRKQ